ncbi:MAG: S8 family peptidase, partial [Anaerolineae bacterium]|nr:S8 family peptidase [Anaerolineae bacterium]
TSGRDAPSTLYYREAAFSIDPTTHHEKGKPMRSRARYRAVLILLFGALLLIGPGLRHAEASVPPATSGDSAYRSGELLIKFKPHVRAVERQAVQTLARVGAERTGELSALGVEHWQIPAGQEIALAEKLNALPDVEYAEPNYLVRAHLTPDDTYYDQQWSHTMINSPAAWDLTTGSGAVTVAVIDTGVDLQNAELQGRLTAGWDYVNDDDDPDDDHWHGTHVAGVIAATGNNHQGIAGMAWQTLIMPMKVLDNTGSGTDADTAKAITDAVDNGADIINISLGGVDGSQTLYNAVKYAYNHGVLVVASGGNCGDVNYERNGCSSENQTIYPAAYDTEVFAVAATSDYDVVATFSNRGDYIDVAAPGTDIYSTVLNNGFWWASGTSQAAPHVSGLAALLLAIDPTLTAQEIQTHIETASVDLGTPDWDPAYGAGRIDAYAALVHTNITLSPPTLLAIDNADRDGSFWVDWPNVTYATSYTLEEDDNESFSSPVTVYSESASQTQITGQSTGTWYYRARAVRASIDLTSEWSNTGSVKVGLDTPTLNPINNAGSANYTVTWNAVDGATAYRLQESASADFSGATTRDMGANLSYNVVDQDGGIWFYRLQATTGVVDSNWSATRSAVVLPDPPQLYAIVAGSEPDA